MDTDIFLSSNSIRGSIVLEIMPIDTVELQQVIAVLNQNFGTRSDMHNVLSSDTETANNCNT